MSSMSDFDAPTKPAWVGAIVPVVMVLGAAGLYWIMTSGNGDDGNGSGPYPSPPAKGKLVEGRTYYLFASEIELYSTNFENESWDLGDGGPDIFYRLLWQGIEVFESKTRADSLIADWSGLEVELDWLDLLGKNLSPDEVIKGARVRADSKGSVLIKVEDNDVADNDEAGSVEIFLKDLRVGANGFEYKKASDSAIRRITLRVLPVDSSLQDLIAIMR